MHFLLIFRTIQQHRSEFSELKAEFDKTRSHLSDANTQVKCLSTTEQDHRVEIEVKQFTVATYSLVLNIVVCDLYILYVMNAPCVCLTYICTIMYGR